MRRFIFLALAACASQPVVSDADRLKAKCQRDPSSDPQCINVLTSTGEVYESRAQVMQAEAQREQRAFSDRLARLRAAEEARQLARVRASTVAAQAEVDPDIEDELENPDFELEKSSIRAVKAERAEPAVKETDFAPTPEDYLRGAHCLVSRDVSTLKTLYQDAKRQKTNGNNSGARSSLGALAVVILDAESLVSSVDAELEHRGLAKGARCEPHRAMVELLRRLVGPKVQAATDADAYQGGVTRLRGELETRAGLPKVR